MKQKQYTVRYGTVQSGLVIVMYHNAIKPSGELSENQFDNCKNTGRIFHYLHKHTYLRTYTLYRNINNPKKKIEVTMFEL